MINGLAFLHQQYQKPLNEFRELDRYFTRQLSALPANQVDPRETASLGKKLFKGKELKEERDAFSKIRAVATPSSRHAPRSPRLMRARRSRWPTSPWT